MQPNEACDPGFLDIYTTIELNEKTLVMIGVDPSHKNGNGHTIVVYKRYDEDSARFAGYLGADFIAAAATAKGNQVVVATPIHSFIVDPAQDPETTELGLFTTLSFAEGGRNEGGILRNVSTVADSTYAVDNVGGVYKLDQANHTWKNIFEHDSATPMFSAITGFAANDLYAVASDGQIWHYNGKEWTLKETPTDYILTNACVCGEYVYACGVGGMLLRGRNDTWEQLTGILKDTESDKEFDLPFGNLFSIASVDDTVVVCSESGGVFKVVGTEVTTFDDFVPALQLSSGPSGILGTSATLVRLYDGTKIEEIYRRNEKADK